MQTPSPHLTLSELLYGVRLSRTAGSMDIVPAGLTQDTRAIVPGGAFVAIIGTQTDGHNFIGQAIEAGAKAIICERWPDTLTEGVTYVLTPDTAEALGQMACVWYGNPSRRIKLVGVTGTNGKTTVTTLLYQVFGQMGERCGLISTVANQIGEERIPSTHTTPDALGFNALLTRMIEAGCHYCFAEVSSHAVAQRRIAGLTFAGGVFTNLSHDHLDFHGTFDNYLAAKKRFFDDLPPEAFVLTNLDDRRGRVMVQNTRARIRGYALEQPADYKARFLAASVLGNELELDGHPLWTALPGRFNAANSTAVYGVGRELGMEAGPLLEALSAQRGAPGRFETFRGPGSEGPTAIVDYAHTPDALANVLDTIQNLREPGQRVITVVGCGGDRDRAKRPEMGKIAASSSDVVVLTSDNPRSEDPQTIIDEIMSGIALGDRRRVHVDVDRRQAITLALHSLSRPGDIVLVAGKGHETYQEIAGVRHSFDDRRLVAELLARQPSGPASVDHTPSSDPSA